MPLTKTDLKAIKETVVDAVDPYFVAIQKDFQRIDERFDKIEKFLLEDHRRRIEFLEKKVERLEDLLAVK